MKASPTETLAAIQKSIIGTLGGMIMPMLEPLATVAAAKFLSYPLFSMPGMSTAPTAAQTAAQEPQIAAKNMEASIATSANPPLRRPRTVVAKVIIRSEMPPLAIRLPASIKKGRAR